MNWMCRRSWPPCQMHDLIQLLPPAPENPGQRFAAPQPQCGKPLRRKSKSSPVLTATGRNIWKCSTARNSPKSSSGRKIAARLKQTEQFYRATIKVADPTDEELKIYYNLVKDRLKTPDLRQARHIFLSTLHKDDNQVKQAAEVLVGALGPENPSNGWPKVPAKMNGRLSAGGSLGWINPARTAETLI